MSRLAHSLRRSAPASGGGGGGPVGQQAWTTPGTYNFTVPSGVTSICGVCVGGGATGAFSYGGYGGCLAYSNDIAVTPGEVLTIISGAAATTGGASSIKRGSTALIQAKGGGGSDTFVGTYHLGAQTGAGRYWTDGTAYSGGVGLLGEPSGAPVVGPYGTGGTQGRLYPLPRIAPGFGASGGVRIIWGAGRAFPSTNTGDL